MAKQKQSKKQEAKEFTEAELEAAKQQMIKKRQEQQQKLQDKINKCNKEVEKVLNKYGLQLEAQITRETAVQVLQQFLQKPMLRFARIEPAYTEKPKEEKSKKQ